MIEGGAILAVSFVSLLIYVISRASVGHRTATEQRVQLQQNIALYEQRLGRAEQQAWDAAMREGISGQLFHARRELAALDGSARRGGDLPQGAPKLSGLENFHK